MGLSLKIFLVVLLAIGGVSVFAEVSVAAGIQIGFGGIAWATPLNQINNCTKVGEREGIQYCIRKDQFHTLLGEMVSDVLYGFHQDTFFAVFFGIEDDEAYSLTKRRLVEQLGVPGTTLDREGTMSTHRWTDGLVQIELFNDTSEQGFKLVYYYMPIAKKVLRTHKSLLPPKRLGIPFFPTKKGDIPEAMRILEF